MMGWQDQIGSLEKGKYADIVAVAGDPLQESPRCNESIRDEGRKGHQDELMVQ